MTEFDLRDRFPDLTPVTRVPFLISFLGCGLRFSGAQRHDHEIASFVTNYCLSIFLMPVLIFRAYRIIQTTEGPVIAGREPLTAYARVWNVLSPLLITSVLASVWWNHYSQSPEYLARRKLLQADAAARQQRLADAAHLYREVAGGETRQHAAALDRLAALLKGPLQNASADEAAETLKVVVEIVQLREQPADVLRPFEQGMRFAAGHEAEHPAAALEVLNAVAPLAPDREAFLEKLRGLLERLVELHPDEIEHVSQLAVVYEEQGRLDLCESVLAAHRERLDDSEGARILGQIYARAGKFEDAYDLLHGYVHPRLAALHEAEESYQSLLLKLQEDVVARIRNGQAPQSLYRQLREAGEQEAMEIANAYIRDELKDDPALFRAQLKVLQSAPVASVAMNLGMMLLHRARQIGDEQARTAEMKQAEELFLEVRGFASDSSQYRLSLGEVYYWLGKPEDGRRLLDEYLNQNARSHAALMAVGSLLRDLGSSSEARPLMEEAFQVGADEAEKHSAATLRSITAVDLDDKIAWLRRANAVDPEAQALLEDALSRRAELDGNLEAAARHLRAAINIYANQSESTGVLNNSAVVYARLFELTGDLQALDKRVELLERAVQLSPSNAIVLRNTADALLAAAIRDIIGDALDLQALKEPGGLELLPFLYNDAAGQQQYIDRVRSHPRIQNAIRHLEQAQLIAPKNAATYQALGSLRAFLRDAGALEDLLRRIGEAAPDRQDQIAYWNDYTAGKKDEELTKASRAAVEKRRQILAALDSRPRDATFAVAAAGLSKQFMSSEGIGLPIDRQEVVRLAEEAYAAAPSVAARNQLVWALCFRVSQARAEHDAHHRRLLEAARRDPGSASLLALLLASDEDLRQQVLDDPDLQRAIDLIRESAEKTPDRCDLWDWTMLTTRYPQVADELAPQIRTNRVYELQHRMTAELNPVFNVANLLRAYHAARLGGDEEATARTLDELRQHLPLDGSKAEPAAADR